MFCRRRRMQPQHRFFSCMLSELPFSLGRSGLGSDYQLCRILYLSSESAPPVVLVYMFVQHVQQQGHRVVLLSLLYPRAFLGLDS